MSWASRSPALQRWFCAFLASAVAVVVVGLAGLVVGEVTASAVGTTYAYGTAAYVYDGPALLSSPDTVARGVRGSPERPGPASWVSPVFVRDRGVAANTGRADFIASADGVVIPTSRSRLVASLEDAGLPSAPTRAPGTQYTLPDGSMVRVMEPSGQAPLRASFTDAFDNAINPFTGKQPQPPPGVSGAAWRQMMRDLTYLDLGP